MCALQHLPAPGLMVSQFAVLCVCSPRPAGYVVRLAGVAASTVGECFCVPWSHVVCVQRLHALGPLGPGEQAWCSVSECSWAHVEPHCSSCLCRGQRCVCYCCSRCSTHAGWWNRLTMQRHVCCRCAQTTYGASKIVRKQRRAALVLALLCHLPFQLRAVGCMSCSHTSRHCSDELAGTQRVNLSQLLLLLQPAAGALDRNMWCLCSGLFWLGAVHGMCVLHSGLHMPCLPVPPYCHPAGCLTPQPSPFFCSEDDCQ